MPRGRRSALNTSEQDSQSTSGGIIFSAFGGVGGTGFNLWSLFVATIGAVVILVVPHALFDRRD
jgi:uncharacterized membrane protein YeaQ/YmgE (transglycosylase-associated protein family)